MSYPTTSVRSFSSVLSTRAQDPFAICLGVGLAASSYFVMGNLTDSYWGVAALVLNEKERRKVGLERDLGKCIEIWAWQWRKGSTHMTIASLTSSLAYIAAGFCIPISTLSTYPRNMRRLTWGAGLLGLVPLVWSLVALGPLDATLLAKNDKIVKSRAVTPASSKATAIPSPTAVGVGSTENAMNLSEEREIVETMESWKTRHAVRTAISSVAWGLGVVSVFLAY